MKQLLAYQDYNGLVVVFSTYQSVDAVSAAQQEVLKATNNTYGKFDFIVCDEAHRTTGVKISDANESSFTKIHSNENVQGEKVRIEPTAPQLLSNPENAEKRFWVTGDLLLDRPSLQPLRRQQGRAH